MSLSSLDPEIEPVLTTLFLLPGFAVAAESLPLMRAGYADRAHGAWVDQMSAVFFGFPFLTSNHCLFPVK